MLVGSQPAHCSKGNRENEQIQFIAVYVCVRVCVILYIFLRKFTLS